MAATHGVVTMASGFLTALFALGVILFFIARR